MLDAEQSPLLSVLPCELMRRKERSFSRFVMRLELRFRNFQASVTGCGQPSIHSYADFSEGLFRRAAECRAGLQIRNISDPSAVVLGPEYDDGVAVHGHSSSLNPNSSFLTYLWLKAKSGGQIQSHCRSIL